MPKIYTIYGPISYKTVPLFPGVKVIDKEIAADNLLLAKEVLDDNELPFVLFYGTLLGAIRDADFIDHDEDIDLAMGIEYRSCVFDCLPQFMNLGFRVARYDRKGLLSLIRNGEYIDFYFFHPYVENELVACVGNLTFERFLTQTRDLVFKGATFQIPCDFADCLELEYGPDWRIPVVYNDYNMPKWKIALLKLKEYVKELLPDDLYFYLSRKAEMRTEDKSWDRMKAFKKSHNL